MAQYIVSPETEKRIIEYLKTKKVTVTMQTERIFLRAFVDLLFRKFNKNGMYTCIYFTLEQIFDFETMRSNRECPYCGFKARTLVGLLRHLNYSSCYKHFAKDMNLATEVYAIAKMAKHKSKEKCIDVVKVVLNLINSIGGEA